MLTFPRKFSGKVRKPVFFKASQQKTDASEYKLEGDLEISAKAKTPYLTMLQKEKQRNPGCAPFNADPLQNVKGSSLVS